MQLDRVHELVATIGDPTAAPVVVLAALRRVRGWLDAQEASAAARVASEASVPELAVTTATGCGLREAERVVERATVLQRVPRFAEALGEGAITGTHADTLARGLRQLEPAEQAALLAGIERLTEAAASQPADTFARTVGAAVRSAKRATGIEILTQQVRDRRLAVWADRTTGMVRLSGQLDPLSGLALMERLRLARTQVEPAGPGPSDPLERSSWLTAHALLRLLETPASVELTVVADERGGAPVHDWGADTALPDEITELLRHHARTRVVVIRADGTAVTDAPLELGRTRRLASAAQRDVLRALHPTCAIPGCTTRFALCEIHHLHAWELGGRTDLENLRPICAHHHTRLHTERWSLRPLPRHGLVVEYPDGTTQYSHPPPPRRAA
jgi:hypothetical protein